jgi:hypothetical protein
MNCVRRKKKNVATTEIESSQELSFIDTLSISIAHITPILQQRLFNNGDDIGINKMFREKIRKIKSRDKMYKSLLTRIISNSHYYK